MLYAESDGTLALSDTEVSRSFSSGVYVSYSGTALLDQVTVTDNDFHGIWVFPRGTNTSATLVLTDSTVANSVHQGVRAEDLSGSTLVTVSGSSFVNNHTGVEVTDNAQVTLRNNTFTGQTDAALTLRSLSSSASLSLENNTGSDNGRNGIRLMHGLGTSLTLPAHDPSFPYMFYNLTIPSGTSVVIPAGTVIKTEGYILVSGTLQAQGTATNPVIFTSLNDDSVGGLSLIHI